MFSFSLLVIFFFYQIGCLIVNFSTFQKIVVIFPLSNIDIAMQNIYAGFDVRDYQWKNIRNKVNHIWKTPNEND